MKNNNRKNYNFYPWRIISRKRARKLRKRGEHVRFDVELNSYVWVFTECHTNFDLMEHEANLSECRVKEATALIQMEFETRSPVPQLILSKEDLQRQYDKKEEKEQRQKMFNKFTQLATGYDTRRYRK